MNEIPGPVVDRTGSFNLGLVGWPLDHSFSPRLHRAALESAGLDGVYNLYPVQAGSDAARGLNHLVGQIRSGRLDGLNVTIPHKQTLIPWLDRLTPTARLVGAVNTLFREADEVVGDNTDVEGFLGGLQALGIEAPGKALVLGAGGAARAAAFALGRSGWEVLVAARRPGQAKELIQSIGFTDMRTLPLTPAGLAGAAPACHLIVNGTPLGMAPLEGATAWPDAVPLPGGAAVYDLVYNPPVTKLMARARADGLVVENGLGMLIEQAALSFQRWTGVQASRSSMREAVMSGIGGDDGHG